MRRKAIKMRLLKSHLLLTIPTLFLLAAATISTPSPPEQREELPINIYADSVEWDKKQQVIKAQGFAHARHGEAFLTADQMEYNVTTGDLKAWGNVVFEYQDSRIFARRMEFNVNTTVGILYDAEGLIAGAYFITSKKVERLSSTKYNMEEGSFTTCRCGNPSWSFTLDKAALQLDRFAVLKKPTFLIKGLPVASLPIAVVPAKTERATGFLFPLLGTSSLNGFTAENRFFWAINERSDATIGLDYLSKRGLRPNLEYRYIASRDSLGEFYGSILKDRSTDSILYEVQGSHYQRFKHDVVSEMKLDLESAISPSRTFEMDVERRAKVRTDSYLYARKNWESRALQMEGSFLRSTLEHEAPSFAVLPELTFFNTRERLLNTPLYYDLSLTFSNFMEEFPRGDERGLSRLDLFPKLSFPLPSLSWWDFTQTIGFRETFYSEQKVREEPLTRELFFSQSLLEAPRFYKTYNLSFGKIDRLVHTVEPTITYDFVSDNEADIAKRILGFDEVDDFGAKNALSYALTNRLIVRDITDRGGKQVREVARISIGQSYDIEKARDETAAVEPFSEILLDVETWFLRPLRVNFDGLYSLEEDGFETMNFEVDYRFTKYLDLEFDSRLKRGQRPSGQPRTDYIRAGIGVKPSQQWYIEYAARVNMLLEKKVAESSFMVKYTSQCWAITARLVDRVSETIVDFQIELLGLGGVGKKISHAVNPEVLPEQ